MGDGEEVLEGEEEVLEGGLCSVRVTGMETPGRPSVVSRMWHVIGGLGVGAGVAIVGVGVVEGGVCANWFVRVERRVLAWLWGIGLLCVTSWSSCCRWGWTGCGLAFVPEGGGARVLLGFE